MQRSVDGEVKEGEELGVRDGGGGPEVSKTDLFRLLTELDVEIEKHLGVVTGKTDRNGDKGLRSCRG